MLFILFKVPILSMYVCNWIGMLLNTDTAPLSHPNIVNSAGVNKGEIDLRIIKSPGHLLYFPLHCSTVVAIFQPIVNLLSFNPNWHELRKKKNAHL